MTGPDKRFVLAVRAYQAGLYEAAEADLNAILDDHPEDTDARELLASVKFQFGRHALQTGNVQRAIAVLNAAIELAPANAEVWSNLGLAHQEAGDIEKARVCFESALDHNPAHFGALNNLGLLLAGQGWFSAAQDCFEQAVASEPSAPAGHLHWAMAQLEQGDALGAITRLDALPQALTSDRNLQDVRAYAEVYVSDDPPQISRAQAVLPAQAPSPRFEWDGQRALRVGFVSADFRRHSVAFFSRVLFSHLPSKHIEVIGISNTVATDNMTHAFQDQASAWMDISHENDRRAAELIAQAHVDVLVDLSGRTIGHRQGVFALRPAPIQLTALGYPATTGAAYFDGRWVDPVTDIVAHRGALTEGAFELAHLHHFTPGPAPEVTPLPNSPITFASFNKWAKVSPRTLDLWSAVLQAVPGSRMLLKAKALTEARTRDRALAAFEERGIPAERLDVRGWSADDADHLAMYSKAHIGLDTLPYTGTTTTCEALWMGVPVLTLCGQSHASRVSASLLTSAGLSDWIVQSQEELVERAGYWAAHLDELALLRSGLREKLKGSALCDGAAYARDLEAKLLALARSFLDQEA